MKAKTVSEDPKLMAQWHPTKNTLDPTTTSSRARKKAWWFCYECGYEWQANIDTRAASSGKCPNCLKMSQIKNVVSDTWLMESWGDNPNLDPTKTPVTSKERANWHCPVCDYDWQATINTRYYQKTGCPVCTGHVVKPGQSALDVYPDLTICYDYDYPDNPDLSTLTPTSETEVHWRCPVCDYRWVQSVGNRLKYTPDGVVVSGCQACALGKSIDDEIISIYSPNNDIPASQITSRYRDDVFLWLCIECGDEYTASLRTIQKRTPKERICYRCAGRPTFSQPLPTKHKSSVMDVFLENIQYSGKNAREAYHVDPNSAEFADWTCEVCGCDFTARVSDITQGIANCPYCNGSIKQAGINSLDITNPELKPEWSPNNPPMSQVYADDIHYYEWICQVCGGIHKASVVSHIAGTDECLFCKGIKVEVGVNSLADTHAELRPYWRDERSFEEFHAGSAYNAHWSCQKCSGLLYVSVRDYTTGNYDCPYCNNRVALPGYNTLQATRPEVMTKWDWLDNYAIVDPDTVLPTSSEVVFWHCSEGHLYKLAINRHILYDYRGMTACPKCKGLNRKKSHFYIRKDE